MKTLVSFSGGLDSTYIMWKLLTTTDDEITAVFFDQRYNIVNANHGESELAPYLDIVSNNVAEWLRTNIRGFHFIKKPVFELKDDEVLTVHFARYGANLVEQGLFDRIASGQVGFGDACLNQIGLTTRVIAAEREFHRITSKGKFWTPLMEWNKRTPHQLAEMPRDLIKLANSCQRPHIDGFGEVSACGNCEKCDRNAYFIGLLNQSITPDEAVKLWRETDYSRNFQKRIIKLFLSYQFDNFEIWRLT